MKRVYTISILDIPIESVEKQMKDYIEKYKIHIIRCDMGGNKKIHKIDNDGQL